MITADALPVEQLEAAYGLGPWTAIELLPGGKSQHFRFRAGNGVYVLRRSYRSKTEAGMEFEHSLISHLREHGFPAPTVLRTVEGLSYRRVGGRLYCITEFVEGDPYHAGNKRQLEEVARTLGAYHSIVSDFAVEGEAPANGALTDSMKARLVALEGLETTGGILEQNGSPSGNGDGGPDLNALVGMLPFAVEVGSEELEKLEEGWGEAPRVIVHAGCRRGSAFFDHDSLIAMIDFDSAHRDVRVLDLAVALHDFAKVYGDPDSPEFKVPLDLEVVAQFMETYSKVVEVDLEERRLIPAVLITKRLKRALGRYARLLQGSELSLGDRKKIALEVRRVQWLKAHEQELTRALMTGSGA